MRYSEVDSIYKIDIISFLRNYLGISVDSLKQNKLTHKDLLVLFPNIKLTRIPYDIAYKNPDLVYSGEYLIVYDCKHELIVYRNPMLDNVLDDVATDNYEQRTYIDLPTDLRSLSKDELLKLRKKVRDNREFIKADNITKEIRRKKRREPKQYRKKLERLRYRDMEEDL